MGHVCLNRGAEAARNGLPAYKHYCAVVDGKKIVSEEVNEYAGVEGTLHAEELALLRAYATRYATHPGWREKGCYLQGCHR
jgi:pyrimidine deaminase RibD-like protein